MRELLLVDDDAHVLNALATCLRRVRDRYHVRTAIGAQEALQAMREQPADLVITDIRMPGTDGEALLVALQHEWPATVRLVLSGQHEPAVARRLSTLAHLFLAKPVEIAQLVETLDRMSAVLDRLTRPELRELVGKLRRLPILSRTSRALRTILESPEATARDIATTIELSPSLTAKVLHLGNSAFFAASAPVTSVERAVTVIGVETLQALVLAADLFVVASDGTLGTLLQRLQLRALFAARIARALTPRGQRLPQAWTAAILHDIGLVAMVAEGPDLLDALQRRMQETGEALDQAELALWGTTHAEVGAYLLGLWGFEWSVLDAVGSHHDSLCEGDPNDSAAIVRMAAAIADDAFPLAFEGPAEETVGFAGASHPHDNDGRWERWREFARAHLEQFIESCDVLSRT